MGFYETRKALGELSSLYESSVLSEKKKDDSYLETDMKKRQANNEKARKDMEKMGTKMKNPHFEETQVVEKLDPVGQEDADIDNDGDTDSSDKYLHKRRKAISKAIKAKKKTVKEQEAKIGGGNLKTLAAKATTRIDADVDGDVDTHDPKSKEMGEYVPGPGGKKLKPKVQKEAFHDWRTDLREIISTDDEDQKEVKEKTVKNKVVIDPELKLENFMGGEVLEIIESETCPVCGCDPCQCLEGNLKQIDEISANLALTASQKADEERRKAALAGDKGRAAAKAQQASRIYKGVGPRRAKERMAEGVRDIDPEKGTKERKARLEKKRGMKLDDHPQYKKEEVEVDEKYQGMYQSPAPTHNRLKSSDEKARMSPGRRAMAKSDELEKSEPGSKRAKAQKKAAGQIARNFQSARMTKEETEDSLRDRRMERGGVDGNTRYDRAPKAPNTKKFGTGKTAVQKELEKRHGKGKSAMDIVRAEIRAKHGKGAVMDTKKK